MSYTFFHDVTREFVLRQSKYFTPNAADQLRLVFRFSMFFEQAGKNNVVSYETK